MKITKDGKVLLSEMSIIHPTAAMIARASISQDDVTGDGTNTTVILIGELLKHSERFVHESIHPRIITEGIEFAKLATLKYLEQFKQEFVSTGDSLRSIAMTSIGTKVPPSICHPMADIIVNAVNIIGGNSQDSKLDLHMIEIIKMQHESVNETRLIKGLVLDHGSRHPEMPKRLKNCFILNLNVSLEYEKTYDTNDYI